jgi:D-sedoheptulose 7-phosphate isomerase
LGVFVGTIEVRFEQLVTLLPKFQSHAEKAIEEAAILIADAFAKGNKILICGNGGSAADSQHFAAEFVNAFSRKISRKALPAIALSTDTSVLTSIANDFTFDDVFSRQVEAYAIPGDVLVVLTTSGSSMNCIKAVASAKVLGVTSIAFSQEGAEISKLVDLCIEVPSDDTQHIQECHILAYHVITELVEDNLFGDLKK